MKIIVYAIIGFLIAFVGSICPSYLNLTVVKFSLNRGRKAALFLIAGFATVLFVQANIGAYLANILMKNSEYLEMLQKVGTGILILLSIYFFRLHLLKRQKNKNPETTKSKAYAHGIGMALLNTFAIPFYFTAISLLIGLNYFEYSFENGIIFSVGSSLGSFSMYAIYATISSNIEHKLTYLATKLNFLIGCLTGLVGTVNLIFLLQE